MRKEAFLTPEKRISFALTLDKDPGFPYTFKQEQGQKISFLDPGGGLTPSHVFRATNG